MSQDVVDICLEMFNCVSAEQTVAKTRFLEELVILAAAVFVSFVAEAVKELATL